MTLVQASYRQPLVSIVIPVYNMERYLRECLDSVLAQTLRDIEVICVNDGSTDGSHVILLEYASNDKRIRILDKTNGGVASARNAAIKLLRGKYTFFADADDRLDPTLCEKTFCAAEHVQADVCFLFVKTEKCPAPGPLNVPLALASPGFAEREFLLSRINGGPCTKLLRTLFLLDHGIEFPPYRIGEDQLVHWKTCLLAGRVAICPEQLYWYRNNPASAMNSGGEKCLDIIDVFTRIKEFLLSRGLYEPYQETFLAQKLDHIYLECHALPPALHVLRRQRVRETLGADEIDWLRSGSAPASFRYFFLSVEGDWAAGLFYGLFVMRQRLMKYPWLDRLKRKTRAYLLVKFSSTAQDTTPCETAARLHRETVRGESAGGQ